MEKSVTLVTDVTGQVKRMTKATKDDQDACPIDQTADDWLEQLGRLFEKEDEALFAERLAQALAEIEHAFAPLEAELDFEDWAEKLATVDYRGEA